MDRSRRLAETTLALVDIASESRSEGEAAAWVDREIRAAGLPAVYGEELTLLYTTERRRETALVVLAGHLDTVPAQGNRPGRIEGGSVHGVGASDMKGGLAVMVELARWLAEEKPPLALDLGLLFFPREELPAEESALPALFAAPSAIHEADLVVVLEPTDNSIQAGCLGNLNAGLTWRGRSAHSARPWLGENAIERAVLGLAAVLPIAERVVEIDGLRFVEVASATAIAGGIAPNVIPAEASCLVNFRYAPDRSPQEAEAWARELAGAVGAELALAGNSPAAPVLVDAPLVQRLRRAGSFEVEAKQAWTPVAEFAAAGLDAVNLGPGATRYAHTRDEQVPIRELERTFEAFARFFAGDE